MDGWQDPHYTRLFPPTERAMSFMIAGISGYDGRLGLYNRGREQMISRSRNVVGKLKGIHKIQKSYRSPVFNDS